ncbi:MAG: AzlC family ABC transporter permease [Methylobacteriaceae bacterium]|nr:AzlC family ABC transporter permease [Methylobacteriaceae bacterium]
MARDAVAEGVRSALALPAWIVAFSFLGVGSLARDAGHPLGAAIFSTFVIWAAPAQLILYGTLASGGLVAAAGIAVGLSGIRLLPMTLAIWPYLGRPGQSLLSRFLFAHLIAATTWIDGMRRLPGMPAERRQPYFLGFALTCLTLSVVMTLLGYVLVGTLPGPLAAGLLCLTPIYFTISLAGAAVRVGDWLAIGLGLALAPVAAEIGGGDYDLLATGLIGGTLAYLGDRVFRRAPAEA